MNYSNYFTQSDYFLQYDIDLLPSSMVSELRRLASKEGIESTHLKVGPAKKSIPIANGNTLLFKASTLDKLRKFFIINVESYKYLKSGQKSSQQYVLKKGKTKVKAVDHLQLFEKKVKLKVTKGFIEVLEPLPLIKAGEKADSLTCKMLKALDVKLKQSKGKVINLFSSKKNYSTLIKPYFQNDYSNDVSVLVQSLNQISNKTYSCFVPQRLGPLLNALNNSKMVVPT